LRHVFPSATAERANARADPLNGARYVTFDDLREWRKRGMASVLDAETGEDVSRVMLACKGRVDERDHAPKQNPLAVDPVLRDDQDGARREALSNAWSSR
jgi:hypothetical protein